MPIQFACPECQKRFSVKDELADKVAKCSGCGKKIRIPQAKPQPQAKPVPIAARSSLDDILDDYEPPTPDEPELDIPPEIAALLQNEIEAERKKREEKGPPTCPSCGNKYIGSTVVCVTCGFDSKTGERPKGLKKRGKVKRKKTQSYEAEKARMTLSFVRGTVFSVIGAALGGCVWFGIALFEFESGIFEWLVGLLAGGGMSVGHDDDEGTPAGVIAGSCATVGILAAKYCVFALVMPAMSLFGLVEPGIQRGVLLSHLAEQQLAQQGVDLETAREPQYDAAFARAEEEVSAMSNAEVVAKLEALGLAADVESMLEEEAGGEMPMSFADMFSIYDLIFFPLAIFTAYRIGSGKVFS